jgi:hypothetical protein
MGTWGAGNLDSDYALDEISTRSAALIDGLMERARRRTSREWDEYDYTTLFVEFEMVFALEARGLMSESGWPTPEEVEALKKDFIAEWDAGVAEAPASSEHWAKRRPVILRTFSRFKRLCKKYADE